MVPEPFFWRRRGLLKGTVLQQNLSLLRQEEDGGEVCGQRAQSEDQHRVMVKYKT